MNVIRDNPCNGRGQATVREPISVYFHIPVGANFLKQNSPSEADNRSAGQEITHYSPRSQEPAADTGSFFKILSLPRCLLASDFPTKTLHSFFICPTHTYIYVSSVFFLLDLITFDEEHKL
jgi:hypothetical protein